MPSGLAILTVAGEVAEVYAERDGASWIGSAGRLDAGLAKAEAVLAETVRRWSLPRPGYARGR